MNYSLSFLILVLLLLLKPNYQNGSIFKDIQNIASRHLCKAQGILTAHFREDKSEVCPSAILTI